MKFLEDVKKYRKEFVFDNYSRIIKDYKEYEKISKVKMVSEVYKLYSDYENVIDICTVRELKLLEKCLKDKVFKYDNDNNFEWERNALISKFILVNNHSDGYVIAEEIYDSVREAILNVDWKMAREKDKLNEFLVSYCKIFGTCLWNVLIQIASRILNVEEEVVFEHVKSNRVFNYYVYMIYDDFNGKEFPFLVYQDYWNLVDVIKARRAKYGKSFTNRIDVEDYKTLFYNNFNVRNSKIKKFYEDLKSLPFFWYSVVDVIREYALLNLDRDALKDRIAAVPALSNYDLTKFFKLLDSAMDEMPSGVLNGLSPNELKDLEAREIRDNIEKTKNYVRQKNACLVEKEVKLFYKVYFGLLDFTNQKYKIKPGLKLYNKEGINPNDIIDIVEKFWEFRDGIILEFCEINPYKFNKEEICVVQEFKNGVRDNFIVVKHEEDYTAVMSESKVYMIKGINCNIDEVISHSELPCMVRTTVLSFCGKLIYDGMFVSYAIDLGPGFRDMIKKDYDSSMKYYHL